ncbi:MAG: histidinol-phosphate transaminase [Pseudomonadales bacterium]|nr:histidinol-phosphate transaminase [Pseudomonadales bacterium]
MFQDFISLAPAGIQALEPYQPGKPVEELERELGLQNIIKLASNENPLGASQAVMAGLINKMPELARYPDGSAYTLKSKLAEFLEVDADCLTIGNGSNDVLELMARVFLKPGNEAIVSQHAFVVYPLAAKAIGAELRVVPAKDYCQDLVATLAQVSANTRMIFIANPNNPTGTWVDNTALTQFMDHLRDDILVVLDEAYFEYVDQAGYPDGIELSKKYPNLIVTRTFSKAYGLASLRLGYAVSHPDIADLMNRIRQPFNVNAMSLVAAELALDDQDHVRRSVAMNKAEISRLMNACNALGLGYIPSAGNFLTVDFGKDAQPVYEALLRLGIIVRPIGVYQLPNHLRITIGLPDENVRLIEALKKVSG